MALREVLNNFEEGGGSLNTPASGGKKCKKFRLWRYAGKTVHGPKGTVRAP